jgi:hypothetical protein
MSGLTLPLAFAQYPRQNGRFAPVGGIGKAWGMRIVAKLALGVILVAGSVIIVLHQQGVAPAALFENWVLRADIRALGTRSDAELRLSTNRAVRQIGGPALARTIRLSRDRARQVGTHPVPPAIASVLAPHFPSIDFDQVRWQAASGRPDLGTALTHWYMREGAVVLDDVIVFTSARTTSDLRLWAHELTHVLQYRELGVDGFARVYITGYADLENQAERNAQRIMAELREAG